LLIHFLLLSCEADSKFGSNVSKITFVVRALSQVNGKYLIRSHRVNSFVSPVRTRPIRRTASCRLSMATGQAAGVCAALAARLGKPPRAVPVSDVQIELTRQGTNLRDTQ